MPQPLWHLLHGLFGLAVLLLIAWLLSEDRRSVSWRTVLSGLGLQLLIGLVLLSLPAARALFVGLNDVVVALQTATAAGTAFVFGYIGGGDAPFTTAYPANTFVLAFQALPLLLVIGALSALLFHWRILPTMVKGFAWLLARTMGLRGALGLGAAANVFIGMTEAPLLIRPYLRDLPRSSLFALMTTGMATVAGTVMVLYASILSSVIGDALGHILAASLMSVPAALLVATVLVPPGGEVDSPAELQRTDYRGSIDAITRGALDALPLFLNIVALLVVFVALVSLANQLLTLLPMVDGAPLTLERLLGWIMAPLVWLIGIPWSEAPLAGSLMGIKTVLNEMLAYLQLAALPDDALSERSRLIMTYALCGFANLGSLGIMLGGIGALVPERRSELAALGLKSILAGTLATLMTGAVAGIWL